MKTVILLSCFASIVAAAPITIMGRRFIRPISDTSGGSVAPADSGAGLGGLTGSLLTPLTDILGNLGLGGLTDAGRADATGATGGLGLAGILRHLPADGVDLTNDNETPNSAVGGGLPAVTSKPAAIPAGTVHNTLGGLEAAATGDLNGLAKLTGGAGAGGVASLLGGGLMRRLLAALSAR
ncbi:hypothetical protein B0H16DRAFT_1478207 [Mycena metata]|uniref:Uncharacterized protein n=1 Tax=Mycena metata TaxID=1033252 RepID=A0AAD7H7R1_9AGAR|nr:hypothetical protein B0H16DRAFT_1478207 [Mycena metata]